MVFVMPRYIINGIRFHVHLVSREFGSAVRTLQREARDRQTERQADTDRHFIMPLPTAGPA